MRSTLSTWQAAWHGTKYDTTPHTSYTHTQNTVVVLTRYWRDGTKQAGWLAGRQAWQADSTRGPELLVQAALPCLAGEHPAAGWFLNCHAGRAVTRPIIPIQDLATCCSSLRGRTTMSGMSSRSWRNPGHWLDCADHLGRQGC